jgi:hypothetical protein
MIRGLDSAAAVIDACGGTAAVARLCDVGLPTVSNWRERGFPATTYAVLQAELKRRKHKAPDKLWNGMLTAKV